MSEISKDKSSSEERSRHFIHEAIDADLESGRYDGRVHLRFPPEPNGYLHIGHAKSICLNFGLAEQYPGGKANLRFDDTNPETEDMEFVEAAKRDIQWLGFDWEDRLFFASDYFEHLYNFALQLVRDGKAYVDSQSEEEIRETRGTVKSPGRESPYRERAIEENLDLLRRMREGEFPEGAHVLRAKIDMAAPNMLLRDPLIYRIRHASHYRTGDAWHIYPMYDWAHGLEDSIEGITHSLCDIGFDVHRPLYDWFLDQLGVFHPQQIEFARLNISFTLLSKRKLKVLVEGSQVSGWDDPRMPTISGLRRRGFTPASIRDFSDRIGVARRENLVDVQLLEHCLREDLNPKASRAMAVLRPLKLVIENYPEGQVEELEAENIPGDPEAGTRMLPFGREIYVEREDYREDAPKKWFRLAPGKEVRLKHAYLVTCEEVVKDDSGEILELRCSYDPGSRGGEAPDGRKVRGTLHWVSAEHALDAEVRLIGRLFKSELPEENGDFTADLAEDSMEILTACKLEPSLAKARSGEAVQFLRHGYFVADSEDSKPDALVFNRAVSLRDTWAKIEKKL
jgi:glutaminyl-tRNA synthetase